MDREQTKKLMESEVVQEFIDTCPHCGAKAHLKMIFNDSYKEKNGDLIYYVVFRCMPCKGLILKTYKFKQNEYTNDEKLEPICWEDKFPTEEIIFIKKFEDIVPSNILDDFKEGVVSLNCGCPKAAVTMLRRSLQSAMINLGANKKYDLVVQIKNLGCLTDDIKDWAHNIRIFGNWGTHPQDDNLKDIDDKKAKEAQNFLEEFFNYVYVMPNRVAKAREIDHNENDESGEEKNRK